MNETNLQDLPLWNDDKAQKVLEQVCEKHGVPVDTFNVGVASIPFGFPGPAPKVLRPLRPVVVVAKARTDIVVD